MKTTLMATLIALSISSPAFAENMQPDTPQSIADGLTELAQEARQVLGHEAAQESAHRHEQYCQGCSVTPDNYRSVAKALGIELPDR